MQVVNPGMATEAWTAGALAGEHHATVCKRSGELLPERATYVRRAGGVVLGLDHFCGWLGTPVGLYNRKLFILFVSYSFLFCVVGFFHSLYALLCSLPDSLLPPPPTPAAHIERFSWGWRTRTTSAEGAAAARRSPFHSNDCVGSGCDDCVVCPPCDDDDAHPPPGDDEEGEELRSVLALSVALDECGLESDGGVIL